MRFFNDAIIGNGNILATFSLKGELLRLFYPNIDFRQNIDLFHTSFSVNNAPFVLLHEDINNEYSQHYDKDTNILNTKVFNSYFDLEIFCTDYCLIDNNILVKRYVFTNKSEYEQDINFRIYSKVKKDENCYTSGCFKDNALIQYNHDCYMGITSSNRNVKYQINNVKHDSILKNEDYIGMSNDSAIEYSLGELAKGEQKELVTYIVLSRGLEEIEKKIEELKKFNEAKEYRKTKKYWTDFVKEHKTLNIKNKEENEIYVRSILTFPLYTNKNTGGIIAAPEVDEEFKKCGRYAYCWLRDSIFITKAMDLCNMTKEVTEFFTNFSVKTQISNGMWEQRYYTDGKLAPSWGYQIDETASVVHGVHEHYQKTGSKLFLEKTNNMIEKAIKYLKQYIDHIKTCEPSYNLWEETRGIHIYSLAAIYNAFDCAINIDKILGNSNEGLEEYKVKTKNLIEGLYNNGVYKRNNIDDKADISNLGLSIPFDAIDINDEKLSNTIEYIEKKLKKQNGLLFRYENDNYLNGNAWPIATLWISLYYLKKENINVAKEYLNAVTKTKCEHGFLAEQIDELGKVAWVKGLAWSHAMYIIVLNEIYK